MGLHRRFKTALCTELGTGWGRIERRPGAHRERPVEHMGTTGFYAASPQFTSMIANVDNFLVTTRRRDHFGVSGALAKHTPWRVRTVTRRCLRHLSANQRAGTRERASEINQKENRAGRGHMARVPPRLLLVTVSASSQLASTAMSSSAVTSGCRRTVTAWVPTVLI